MPLSCETHTAFVYDRGGMAQIGRLDPLSRVTWQRLRDDVSSARCYLSTPSADCAQVLSMMEPGRSELVIFRGNERVWEGPITRAAYRGNEVEIEAKDVVHYIYRTIMRGEYDNRYPNHDTVLNRIERIVTAELARKEALSPPINVVSHMEFFKTPDDAGTTAHTLPYEFTVFEHIDALAARSGIDYVALGRKILWWDVHTEIGRTATLTGADFQGDIIITAYAMELATYAAITDGKGRWGDAGGIDDYYGEIEFLDTAFDESSEESATGESRETSIAEMRSQAQRVLAGRNPTPVNVRVPDGSSLNPNASISMDELTPGVWIPLSADLPGRRLVQMQKLDKVEVEEVAGSAEEVRVTLSPAPGYGVEPEDEAQ